MAVVCPKCKMTIEDSSLQRCPRCYTIIVLPAKCEDCKGCSLLKSCKK